MMTSEHCHALWLRLLKSPLWKWGSPKEAERRWHALMDRKHFVQKHFIQTAVVEPVPYEWTYEDIINREG